LSSIAARNRPSRFPVFGWFKLAKTLPPRRTGRNPRIGAKPIRVPRDEIPIEKIEGASSRTGPLFHIVTAAAAIVRHAVDIGAARRIRLGSQQSAVGELAHAQRIGQLDPFIGIGIDGEIPAVEFGGIDPRQQREIAGDHEPLDVVRIGLIARLAHAGGNAGHIGIGGPVECGERPRGAEPVLIGIAGHEMPVYAAYIFAPSKDLADEALGGVDGYAPGAASLVDARANPACIEQPAIEILRDHRVVEKRLAREHGVLIVAEAREPMRDEIVECRFRIGTGDGKSEWR